MLTSRDRQGAGDQDDPEATAPGTVVQSLRDSDDLLTQAGSVLGTQAYMAPEQAAGAVGKVDARSDVFGLGGILAAVLTGQPSFLGDTGETTRVMAAKGKVQDCFARLDASGADPELVALAKRCLAPEKEDRPADADVWRRRWRRCEPPPTSGRGSRNETAPTLALRANLGADAKSGVTTDEARAFADQSVAALADAIKAGSNELKELKEPDFDAVRDRTDFQKLVAELEAKATPAAREVLPPPR